MRVTATISVEIISYFYYEGDVTITASYNEPTPGLRGSFGEPLEPDDPGSFEDIEVVGEDGQEFEFAELDELDQDKAIIALSEAAADYDPYPEQYEYYK